ncbi:MAG TPA: helix-turn-helix transcriptional regulator [Streptosporangiaceae bacterium]|nr:helix-turn-helix transcriptional regulator [Streptosporangiaceae bacterium]
MTTPGGGDLEGTRRDFPHYQIDDVLIFDRRRYVARRTQPGPGPHTLVTNDLAELRAELDTRRHATPPAVHARRHAAAAQPTGTHLMTDASTTPDRPPQRWTTVLDGHRLRQLRRQHGLSQEKLAASAGMSTGTVARLEHQHHAPCRGRTLARLAAALHTEPACLAAVPPRQDQPQAVTG